MCYARRKFSERLRAIIGSEPQRGINASRSLPFRICRNSMNKIYRLVLLAFLIMYFPLGCAPDQDRTELKSVGSSPTGSSEEKYRLVSVLPGITEILFELGLGDRIVGVSRFCHYPPETENIPKIGGYLDLNFEAIIRLRPDLVLLPAENTDLQNRLADFGIKTLAVDQSSFEGMLDSFEKIDQICRGNSDRGRALRSKMEEKLRTIAVRSVDRKPSVMISLDRVRGGQGIQNVYIAGNNPFYQKIIELAGGRNAASFMTAAVPIVSPEGIRQLNPDIIIDLTTDGTWSHLSPTDQKRRQADGQKDWLALGDSVNAVRDRRIYIMSSDYATIPGPRILLFIDDLAKAIQNSNSH